MSIKEITRVWEPSVEASAAGLLALLALADFSDDLGYCWPSHATLAARCRVSERTMIRILADHEKARRIYIIHQPAKGNRYIVLAGLTAEERAARFAAIEIKFGIKIALNGDIMTPSKGVKMSPNTDKLAGKGDKAVSHDPSVDPSNKQTPPAKAVKGKKPELQDTPWTRLIVRESFNIPFEAAQASTAITGQVHNILRALGAEKATYEETVKAYEAHAERELGPMKKPETIATKVVEIRNAQAEDDNDGWGAGR